MELLHSVPMRHFAISGPISRNQKALLRILSYRGMRSWRYCENGNRMPSACQPALPVRRGAPSDDRRMIFLEECARYFIRWTGKKLSASRGSRFANFAQALFSTMEIEQADDLTWQIKRLLQKKRVAKSPAEQN